MNAGARVGDYSMSLFRTGVQERQGKGLLKYKDYKEIFNEYKQVVTRKGDCDFNEDELPEPYQGDPKSGVDAVVLNLNPGMSQIGHYGVYMGKDLEATKFHSNINKPEAQVPSGWLIRKFRDEAECSYRKFVSNWSCLNPDLSGHDPEVCGVYWWETRRMRWLCQIYDKTLCPSRVFAPEICPFHSRSFPTDGFDKLVDFINDHVIIPTVKAVVENDLLFAVAVGSSYAKVLQKLGARMIKEWNYKSQIAGWPTTGFQKRTYQLFSVRGIKGQSSYIIVTWAHAFGLPAPEKAFSHVEQCIREYVSAHPIDKVANATLGSH